MTPDPVALVARAKRRAIPVVSCVRADIRIGHLTGDLDRAGLLALIVVLAECADPARLKAVTDAPGDEGMPALSRVDMLRGAHAEYTRLRRAKLPVPTRLRMLNSEYRRGNKQRRALAAAGVDQQRQGEAANAA